MRFFSRESPSWAVLALFFAAFSPHIARAGDTTSTMVQSVESTTSETSKSAESTVSSSATFSTLDSVVASGARSTSTAPPQTHTVEVGKADHKFRPDVVQANVGDIIEFAFYPANHSVVRAEYKYPCIPYEKTEASKRGFFSGFQPVDIILDEPPKYSIRVNDTSPIFFYCSAPNSCIGYGMVGVINPNSSVSLTTQRQLAQNSSYMLQPGEPFPIEASSSTPSSIPNSDRSSTDPNVTPRLGSKLSGGAIAGVVMGCIGVVVLAAMLFFFWGRLKGLRNEADRKASTVVRNTEPQSPVFYPWSEAPHLTPPPLSLPIHPENHPVPQRNLSNLGTTSRRQVELGLGIHLSPMMSRSEEADIETSPQSQHTTPYASPGSRANEFLNFGTGRAISPPLPLQPSYNNVSPMEYPNPNPYPYHQAQPPSHHHPHHSPINTHNHGYLSAQSNPPVSPPPSYFPTFSSMPYSSSPYSQNQSNSNNNGDNDIDTGLSPPYHLYPDRKSHNINRALSTRSNRSFGGIFDVSPQTGTYSRVVSNNFNSNSMMIGGMQTTNEETNEDDDSGGADEDGISKQVSETNVISEYDDDTNEEMETGGSHDPAGTAAFKIHPLRREVDDDSALQLPSVAATATATAATTSSSLSSPFHFDYVYKNPASASAGTTTTNPAANASYEEHGDSEDEHDNDDDDVVDIEHSRIRLDTISPTDAFASFGNTGGTGTSAGAVGGRSGNGSAALQKVAAENRARMRWG
ncbi:unnamed protein product [Periconia digitata]|uniref:Extracellular serine-rich protein n=1 Tax=Periconia digitata TaxID=1303443 RepID=A0A9W4UM30_9PLEO|nr:unnamed protein product [Periconia digitata]